MDQGTGRSHHPLKIPWWTPGNPPADFQKLAPKPPNPAAHFLLIGYSHGWRNNTLDLKVITDVDCHLFCRFTYSPLRVHMHERDDRGLTSMKTPDYCFVEWHELEEIDPGDHLHHIFHIPNVPVGQQIWFYLRGTVEDKETNSVTAVMQPTHHVEQEILPLWEPWGKTLRENHPWDKLPFNPTQVVSFSKGEIGIISATPEDAGVYIYTYRNDIPLRNPNFKPLTLRADNTFALGNWWWHTCSIAVFLSNGNERSWVEYLMSWGKYWELFYSSPYFWEGFRVFWRTGMHIQRDLLEDWQTLRSHYGQTTDPTGWKLSHVYLFGEGHGSWVGISIINDYIHFYYPPYPGTAPPWTSEYREIRKEENNMITLGIYDEAETLEGQVRLETGFGIELTRVDDHNSIKIASSVPGQSIWSVIETKHPTEPAETTITFEDIPLSYQLLRITGYLKKQTGAPVTITIRFNGDSGNNYHRQVMRAEGAAVSSFANQGTFAYGGLVGNTCLSPWEALIQNIIYDQQRSIQCKSGYPDALYQAANRWTTLDRITRIDVAVPGGHQLDSLSTLTLEGATMA